MRVQPFNYPLDDSLIRKIDLMIARCTQKNPKRDAVLLTEGEEGQGKTTMSIAIAYYVKEKTNRAFNHLNIFFDLKKMIEFLQSTEDQIAVWDEPALQALSKDALTGVVKDLERLLMMSRKKRHFIIINLAYFNKFSEYIVWQRPLGMIHVYSRREIEAGRYCYIRKKDLEGLWQDWRTKRKRNYKRYASKSIRGTFPDVLNPRYKSNVLSDFDVEYYEREKDKAIMMIGTKESRENRKDALDVLRYHVSMLPNRKEIAEKLGITEQTIIKWHSRYKSDGKIEEIPKEIGV